MSRKTSLLASFLILLPAITLADTWISGYYETQMLAKRRYDENDRWALFTPRHSMQMKVYSNPYKGVDLFTQFNADSNNFSTQKRNFFLNNAWGKFWHSKFEVIALKRREWHFVDSPLLNLVDQGTAAYNNDSQGVRLNLFNISRLNGNVIWTSDDPTKKSFFPQTGEWYGNYFDQSAQSFIAKFSGRAYEYKPTRTFFDLSAGYYRKDWQYNKFAVFTDTSGNRSFLQPGVSINPRNEVYSMNTDLGYNGASWNTEVAISTSVGLGSIQPTGDRTAFITEVRDVRAGNFLLLGRYFNAARNFRSELSRRYTGRQVRNNGSNEFDRNGYTTEVTYFEPQKSAQMTFRRTEYRTSVDGSQNNPSLREDYTVLFSSADQDIVDESGELFVQFVNGLQSRASGSHHKDKTGDYWGSEIELKGENPLGYARVQFRIKDLGSTTGLGERFVMGGEFKVNLTDKIQALARAVNVQSNFLKTNWWSGFYQLRYFVGTAIGTTFETYLEYGDGGPTGNIADGWIVDNNTVYNVDQVNLIFRINF